MSFVSMGLQWHLIHCSPGMKCHPTTARTPCTSWWPRVMGPRWATEWRPAQVPLRWLPPGAWPRWSMRGNTQRPRSWSISGLGELPLFWWEKSSIGHLMALHHVVMSVGCLPGLALHWFTVWLPKWHWMQPIAFPTCCLAIHGITMEGACFCLQHGFAIHLDGLGIEVLYHLQP